MMEIEEAVRYYLISLPSLRAFLLEPATETKPEKVRIVPDDISDGLALPCVIYSKVSDTKTHTLNGQSELERPIFQFSAYAISKSIAKQMNNALKTALCDYQGTLGENVIQKIELQSETSTRDAAQKYYVEDLEFEITFIRS